MQSSFGGFDVSLFKHFRDFVLHVQNVWEQEQLLSLGQNFMLIHIVDEEGTCRVEVIQQKHSC